MPGYVLPDIKRGRMTADDKAAIERLAETMDKPTAGKIARKINRHPATVNWFMLTRGLIERKARRAPHEYQRAGKTIYPYAVEHDEFIEARRSEGKPFREIGELVTAKFGIERSGHSVQVRIIQLSVAPEE
jgi:IS30 family transposase